METKEKKKPKKAKKNKYDITVKIDATFDEILKAGLGMKPKTNINTN